MLNKEVRTRFAPSPTGAMHIGNIRAALLNYIFAKKNNGVFILRIEDTDKKRNVYSLNRQIINDLNWLEIFYDEGPLKSGPYAPYYQSERLMIYKNYLDLLKSKDLVYRCFCSNTLLLQEREIQIKEKKPPRYGRRCRNLTKNEIDINIENGSKFIWRFKLDNNKILFNDLAYQKMEFDMTHFSDFAISRQDGSFTFIFANFVDDVEMKITHVIRGEDHLSNTALQVAMYKALNIDAPIFWHLPIITNSEGKKLSKRDFGFSLNDLRHDGFLPDAIKNYIVILGNLSNKEILNSDELISQIDFSKISNQSLVKYDALKLRWINHKHIIDLDLDKLAILVKPFLDNSFVESKNLDLSEIKRILQYVRNDMFSLKDSVNLLKFYFEPIIINNDLLNILEINNFNKYKDILKDIVNNVDILKHLEDSQSFLDHISSYIKEYHLNKKDIFKLIRIFLTGKDFGLQVKDILNILGQVKSYSRLKLINSL